MINHFGGLRESVEIDGKKYYINTDFRVWVEIDALLRNGNCQKALLLAFNEIPEDIKKAMECLILFLCLEQKGKGKARKERLYDFKEDSGLILSSFLREYNIDLRTEYLHWYTFITLLFTLSDDAPFSKAFYYRSRDPFSVKARERRSFLKKMKKFYSLKQEIKDSEIGETLGGAF